MTPIEGLLLAIGVEGPVVLWAGIRIQGRPALWSWLLLVVGANLVTYFPFVTAVEALRPRWGTTVSLIVLETTVALVEGTIYAKGGGIGWRRGLAEPVNGVETHQIRVQV